MHVLHVLLLPTDKGRRATAALRQDECNASHRDVPHADVVLPSLSSLPDRS
jgi:hypothetical protein